MRRGFLPLYFVVEFKFLSDYAANAQLDAFSDTGLNDDEEFEGLSIAARRAAEAKMARRDRLERGGRTGARAAARSRAPRFLDSDDAEMDDDENGLLSGMKRRARRNYDERRDLDDMEGIEDVRVSF